jgi:hypothetical protein
MGDGFLRAVLALSAAGAASLPVFALLLRFQPRFVHGLSVDATRAARHCLLAGACYAGVFLASLAALWLRARRLRAPVREGDESGVRTAYDKHYNLPFGEHASDAFALAMKALDARRSPAIVAHKDVKLLELAGNQHEATRDVRYT